MKIIDVIGGALVIQTVVLYKNINAYTKWFNTIPLLGTTALGANAYFNNNKDE